MGWKSKALKPRLERLHSCRCSNYLVLRRERRNGSPSRSLHNPWRLHVPRTRDVLQPPPPPDQPPPAPTKAASFEYVKWKPWFCRELGLKIFVEIRMLHTSVVCVELPISVIKPSNHSSLDCTVGYFVVIIWLFLAWCMLDCYGLGRETQVVAT